MNRWILFVPFSLLLLSGCCSLRRTTTTTTTEIRVDTLLLVRVDTVPKVVTVTIHDTAKIETAQIRAVSYFDTVMHKIVLRVQQKSFLVPLTIYKRTVNENVILVKKPPRARVSTILFGIAVLLGVILLTIKEFRK